MYSFESTIKHLDLSLQILMLNVQVAKSRFSIEKHFSNNPICFPEILHHFRSTICQQHILIRNVIVLPLTSLEIQVSHELCINPKSLIISSKRSFQLGDAYSNPQKDCWSFAYLLASFRIDKNFWLYHIQHFLKKIVEETMFLTSYLQDFINNAVTANIIPTDSQHRYE